MSLRNSALPFPTLNIGLGGLGTAALLKLLKLGIGFNHRMLSIDSDTTKRSNGERTMASQVVEDLSHLEDRLTVVRLAGFDLEAYREANDDILAGRFPNDPPSSSQLGFAKQRIWGSLGGLASAVPIEQAIRSEITQVRRVKNVDNGILVVNVLAGICGGTGSANVMKVVALCRAVVADMLPAEQVKVQIRLWGILPDAYAVSESVRFIVELNGLMALREITHLQSEGWELVIPDGNGQRIIQVPPGFLDRVTLLSSYNSVEQLDELSALDQLATAVFASSDPTISTTMNEEWIDIRARFDARTRFVSGVGAWIANVNLDGSSEMAAQMQMQRTAQAMLALPNIGNNESHGMLVSLQPINLDAIQREVRGIRPEIGSDDIRRSGSSSMDAIFDEISEMRDRVTNAAGQHLRDDITDAIVEDVINQVLHQASRFSLSSLTTLMQQVATSLGVAPIDEPVEQDLRDSCSTLVRNMVAMRQYEAKSGMGRAFSRVPRDSDGIKIQDSAEELADQISQQVQNHWNEVRQAVVVMTWNRFYGAIQQRLMQVSRAIQQRQMELERISRQPIPQTVVLGNQTNPFMQAFVVRSQDVEAILPEVNIEVTLNGLDLRMKTMDEVLANGGIEVTAGQLLHSHPELQEFLHYALENQPYLSYSSTVAEANSDDGPVDKRGWIMGPPELQQHPAVRQLMAESRLRWAGVNDTQIVIVREDFGISTGAISGVKAWEQKAAQRDLTLSVSELGFLRLPTLIKVRESVIAPVFLLAALLGENLPKSEVPTEDNPWAHLASPDAKVYQRGGNWFFMPYPGAGLSPVRMGGTFQEAWQFFVTDANHVRSQMRRYVDDMVRHLGDRSVFLAVQEFQAFMRQQIEAMNEVFTAQPDDEIVERDAAAQRKQERAQYQDLQWLHKVCERWVEQYERKHR